MLINFIHLPCEQREHLSLVLLHGWGFDSHIWMPLLPSLQKYCSVYCVDLPGFGTTPMMPWNAFDEKLLNILPKKFTLIGWSLGGLVAMRLALSHRERVTHLVSIAASPFFLEEEGWVGVKTSLLFDFEQQLLQKPDLTLRRFKSMQHYPITREPSEVAQHGLIWGLDCLKTWDFRKEIMGFDRPSCFMFGLLDVILPIAICSEMQKKYRDFQYHQFNQSGHLLFLSEQEIFLEKLLLFLGCV